MITTPKRCLLGYQADLGGSFGTAEILGASRGREVAGGAELAVNDRFAKPGRLPAPVGDRNENLRGLGLAGQGRDCQREESNNPARQRRKDPGRLLELRRVEFVDRTMEEAAS